jgi:hypothetical protein
MNNVTISCKLTEHIKTETVDGKPLTKRIADYEYYDGKLKGMAKANFTILGWGKMADTLAKAPAKEVVCEGQMQILVKDRPGNLPGKDRRLEVSLSRLHLS